MVAVVAAAAAVEVTTVGLAVAAAGAAVVVEGTPATFSAILQQQEVAGVVARTSRTRAAGVAVQAVGLAPDLALAITTVETTAAPHEATVVAARGKRALSSQLATVGRELLVLTRTRAQGVAAAVVLEQAAIVVAIP